MTFQTQGEPRRMTIITGLLFEMISPVLGADVERASGRLCRDWLGWPGLPDRCGRGISGVGGSMSFISQRGKEYLETAQTLLRAAQTMTDRAIAGQLEALADRARRNHRARPPPPIRGRCRRRCCSSSLGGVHDRRRTDVAESGHIERQLKIT